jgi:hypothetical protein
MLCMPGAGCRLLPGKSDQAGCGGELCHFKIDCLADTIWTYPYREVP